MLTRSFYIFGLGCALAISSTSVHAEAVRPDFNPVLMPGAASYEGNGVAVDAEGNIYATGQLMANRFTEGVRYADIHNTSFEVNALSDFYLLKYLPDGTPDWVVSQGAAGHDYGTAIRIASNGDPVVTLVLTTNTFHGTELPYAGKADLVVARYSPEGSLLWAASAGGADDDAALDLELDSEGNAYVVGRVKGMATFGETSIGDLHQTRMFLAKYSPSGELMWVKKLGGGGGDIGIEIDGSKVFVTGNINGSISGQSGTGIFLADYDLDGNAAWVRAFSAGSSDGGTSVVSLGEAGLLVAGTYTKTLTLGDFVFENESRNLRGFVARFDTSGNPIWAHQTGARAYAVTADANGSAWAGGFYSSFGPVVVGEEPPLGGGNDAFLVQISQDGVVQSLQTWASDSRDMVRDITTAPNGAIWLTGETWGTGLDIPDWSGSVFVASLQPGTTPQGPRLTVERNADEFIVSWGDLTEGYVLEYANSLSEAFADAGGLFEAVEGQPNTYRVSIGGGNFFLRLRQVEAPSDQ